MGRRGPKSKPVELQLAAGTYRADRHGTVTVRPEVPDAPEWLDEAGCGEWKRLVEDLAELGVLCQIDQTALGMCCMAFSDWLSARAAVAESGWTATTEKGSVYQHPNVGIMNKASERWLRLARELGLTPSARCGMHKLEGSKPDGQQVRTRKRA